MTTDPTIRRVHARRVFDSRGHPTVEVDVELAGGARGRAIAPAGASRGSREAVDLRDGGARFGGRDVMIAIDNVNRAIAAALAGADARDQARVDATLVALDGTPHKSKLGGNALVATSLAVAHAAAAAAGLPLWRYLAGEGPVSLPLPQIQILGGGAHAARRIDIQDLMVMPVGAWTWSDALAIVADVYRAAGEILASAGRLAGVADEGGYWPAFDRNEDALDLLLRAIERSGHAPGDDVVIALDLAATEFHDDGRYVLARDGARLDRDAWSETLLRWVARYPIRSLEDPFAEDDRDAWVAFMRAAPAPLQVVGDDSLVTSAAAIDAAARERACNAALIKVNQAGTLTEARAALAAAGRAGFGAIVSARSGETEDVSIAHLAVGANAGQVKVGSFARGERMAKWNELLRIEESAGAAMAFAGAAALRHR
jgi:enolase